MLPSKYSTSLVEYFGEEVVIGRTRRALLKLAALLHHAIKPQNRQTIDKKEEVPFPRNDQDREVTANTILERLRFSSREKRVILKMIEQHARLKHLSKASELPTPRVIYRYLRGTGDVGIDTMFLSLADHWATYGSPFRIEGCKEHVEIIHYVLAKWFQEKATVSPKLIDGHDLINHFGLAPGPGIGELLESVQEAYALGKIETKEDALYYVKKKLDKRNNV